MGSRNKLIEWLKLGASTLAIVFVMKSFAVAAHFIPSESMVPTLEVGDRLLVTKWPYGYSRHSLMVDPGLPFGDGPDGRLFGALPERGDVVVFAHPRTGIDTIKRVIGLPGDRLQLQAGRLYLNGQLVPRERLGAYRYRDPHGQAVAVTSYRETLPEGRSHRIIERSDRGFADDTPPVVVPPGHLFMLGDNRDNSADSRFAEMGFVPLANVEGRAELITFSWYRCRREPGLACAARRYLSAIE
jgi:signal peptidase I